jgi:FAD/FMN-containing dehydrogenase
MGRCGLSCDNTLSYDLITADGALVTASADERPDLFWGLKGGGGNFGVVTSITYRLHPVGPVISGMLLYPLARAREVLAFYHDFVEGGLPDALIVYAAALTTPDGVPMLAIVPAWSGPDLEEGERVLAPLRAFGPPDADLVARMPYVAMQQMLDAAAPFGLRSYWKSSFLSALPAEAVDTFVRFAATCPSPRTLMMLEHGHGEAARVALDATAFPIRGHAFDFVVVSLWEEAADDARQVAWTRAFHEAMQPWSAALVYVNALSEDDALRVPEAYGDNFARLREVKAKYDPANRFRRNQNVPPAPAGNEQALAPLGAASG